MDAAIRFDSDEIGRICAEHGVSRLRLFGSALSHRFDPVTSDIDFVVDFFPGRQDLFSDFIGMRNVISHEYGEIDYEIVWTAVTVHMQELGSTIDRLLQKR